MNAQQARALIDFAMRWQHDKDTDDCVRGDRAEVEFAKITVECEELVRKYDEIALVFRIDIPQETGGHFARLASSYWRLEYYVDSYSEIAEFAKTEQVVPRPVSTTQFVTKDEV